MVALNGKGETLWKVEMPKGASNCESLACAPGTSWAAAGFQGGFLSVIDVTTGKTIAELPKQGPTMQVAWAMADGEPLLLVATGRSLNAFHVKPTADNPQ